VFNTTKIRHQSEFDAVFKRGSRFLSDCFALHYLKMDRDYPRLGMVISKRNCRLAVHRNRLKRLIREHFRLNRAKLPGFDFVVLLKSSTEKMSDLERVSCIENLFSELMARVSGSALH
jgi:ribonuclease P protein component